MIQQQPVMVSNSKSGRILTCNIDDIITRLTTNFFKNNNHSFYLNFREEQIRCILQVSAEIFLRQPSLVQTNAPITICGDIHGQYEDLLRIFQKNGPPSQNSKYLFLGDYVDRGQHSTQCMVLLLAYKIKYPSSIYILRGNHQSQSLNITYGFFHQCSRKYSFKLWRCFLSCFNTMPICAVISQRIFCMHGGLSPEMTSIVDVNTIKRPCSIKKQGLISDILWSDPGKKNKLFQFSDRGAGYFFGQQAVDLFLNVNDLDMIVRAHQIVQDGYEFNFNKKVLTIFSAPNYCNQYKNDGAILTVNQHLQCSIVRFSPKDKLEGLHQAKGNPNISRQSWKKTLSKKKYQTNMDQKDSVYQSQSKNQAKIQKIFQKFKYFVNQVKLKRKRSSSNRPHDSRRSRSHSQMLQNDNPHKSSQRRLAREGHQRKISADISNFSHNQLANKAMQIINLQNKYINIKPKISFYDVDSQQEVFKNDDEMRQ